MPRDHGPRAAPLPRRYAPLSTPPTQVWRVPITALEPALARVAAAGKTALLLDGTGEWIDR